MRVGVHWLAPGKVEDAWVLSHCLYAYLAPPNEEILYIGKSWGVSVRQRWVRSAKPDFWDQLESERGIRQHRPLVGLVQPSPESRFTNSAARFARPVPGRLAWPQGLPRRVMLKGRITRGAADRGLALLALWPLSVAARLR